MDRPHHPPTGNGFVFDSLTISALSRALNGLSLRQQAISDNTSPTSTRRSQPVAVSRYQLEPETAAALPDEGTLVDAFTRELAREDEEPGELT